MLTPITVSRRSCTVRGPFAAMAAAWMMLSPSVFATAAEDDFLVVDGAVQVQKKRLSDTSWGIIYEIELIYPSRAVGKPQWNQLEAMGWTRCRGGDSDWVSFEDDSVASKRLVHQLVTHWFRGDRLITIGLRYYSYYLPGVSRPADAGPNNKSQFVDITFEDDPKGRDSVMWLAIGCS